jgi:flagellar biosynthesis GTPase FlhF
MTMKHEFGGALGGYKYLIIFLICVCIGGVYGLIFTFENNEWLAIFFIMLIIISVVVIVIVLKLANDRKEMIKRQELDRVIAEEKAKKEQEEAEERTRREQAEAKEKAKRDKVEAEKRRRREQSEADAKTRREQEGSRTSEIWMKKDVGTLIEELGSPDATNRLHAAFFLGVKKEKRAVNALIEALQDRDSNVVGNVIYALGEIGDPQALEPLRKLNDAGVEKLRRIAIEKLRQIKGS